jgi:hypothetical protein
MPGKVRIEFPGAKYHVMSRRIGWSGLTLSGLACRRKSDPEKLAIAALHDPEGDLMLLRIDGEG